MGSPPTCPVCSAACADPPLFRYTAEQAAAHFCPPVREPDRNARLRRCVERLWGGNDCEVLKCRECGFGFGRPFVGGDEEFYSILHEQAGYPKWRWDYDVALDRVIRAATPGKLLDIGAGTGTFLKSLRPGWGRYAVEGSPRTRAALAEAGVTVYPDLTAAAADAAGQFRVVTLFQVLEHLSAFADTLAAARRLLEPGGSVIVTVPDGEAMVRQERLTGCADMPPNHVCKWSPESLRRALGEAGFEPGGAVPQPSSWRNWRSAAHLRVIAAAARPDSLCGRLYRIGDRRLRAPLLAAAGGVLALGMLPHARELRRGGAFAMIGMVPAPGRPRDPVGPGPKKERPEGP